VSAVEDAVAAIRAGGLAVIPTDTVYGLACSAALPEAALALAHAKARTETQPVALVAASLDLLLECVPELRGRSARLARALVPGPYTLVFPNPERRFPWLSAGHEDTIGVRVPDVQGTARRLLDALGVVAATSANLHGGPDPRRVEDVPHELLAVAVVVDGGELPGVPSTVLDLTRAEPEVLREGAVPASEALARVRAVLDAE
jgi:L-threonylcarbamoyladenylate synthase